MKLDLFISIPISIKSTMKVRCSIYSLDCNKIVNRRLVIDTGATTTALTKNLLVKQLDYKIINTNKVYKRTAVGLSYFDTVNVSQIRIGGEFQIKDITVDVLDWEDAHIAGIIGMDILSRLYFYSDTKTFTMQTKPFNIGL